MRLLPVLWLTSQRSQHLTVLSGQSSVKKYSKHWRGFYAQPQCWKNLTSTSPSFCNQILLSMGLELCWASLMRMMRSIPSCFSARSFFLAKRNCPQLRNNVWLLNWPAMQSFQVYLLGRPFLIQTDHRALEWLDKLKENNVHLTWWSLSLQTFWFEVKHRPGQNNGNARDALSRAPPIDTKG